MALQWSSRRSVEAMGAAIIGVREIIGFMIQGRCILYVGTSSGVPMSLQTGVRVYWRALRGMPNLSHISTTDRLWVVAGQHRQA